MNKQNGQEITLPGILVLWDQDKQEVFIQPDQTFKSADFVISILEMAVRRAEDGKRMAIMVNLQKSQMAQASAAVKAMQTAEAVRRRVIEG